jgi:hypothetical protein
MPQIVSLYRLIHDFSFQPYPPSYKEEKAIGKKQQLTNSEQLSVGHVVQEQLIRSEQLLS